MFLINVVKKLIGFQEIDNYENTINYNIKENRHWNPSRSIREKGTSIEAALNMISELLLCHKYI